MLSKEEGEFLVKTARRAVTGYLKNGSFDTPEASYENLQTKQGVFVTIKNKGALRGCIGIIHNHKSLIEATCNSAISAAVKDPRFKPLTIDELPKITFEVSILTVPKQIIVQHPREYPSKINTGVDGLILEYGPWAGLLLPQVPTEQDWDAEEFLNNLCLKANLPITAWLDKKTKILSFQAQIFEELKPNGGVVGRE